MEGNMNGIGVSDIVKDVLKEAYDNHEILANWTTDDIVKEFLYQKYMNYEIRLSIENVQKVANRIREKVTAYETLAKTASA